jgi:FAD/FMN-containing dehydrogenase
MGVVRCVIGTLANLKQQYDEKPKDIFGEHYDKLSQVKAKYDPNNVFNKLFAITPAVSANGQA